MRKTLVILFMVFAVPNIFAADNMGRNVYSIYTENFNGIKTDWWRWTGSPDNAVDNTVLNIWYDGGDYVDVSDPPLEYASPLDSKDGNQYYRITSNGSANASAYSGWCFTFVSGSSSTKADAYRNMYVYTGGTIEFWARSNTPAVEQYQVGFTMFVTYGSGDRTVSLGSRGFTANGQWQKVVIPLSLLNATITSIKNPFLMTTNRVTGVLDIDGIVWKMPGSGTFSVNIYNISDNSPASQVTWDPALIGQGWQAAQQYFELDLDSMPDDNWAIQIYTHNTNASANPQFTGSMTSSMASGMVDSSDTTKMLPMCWRVTDKLLPYAGTGIGDDYDKTLVIGANSGGMYDAGSDDPGTAGYYCWFAFKDYAMFGMGDPDVTNGADYVRVWDKRGFHSAAGDVNYWGMSPGGMYKNMILPRIYLGANFDAAFTPNIYETNSIVIELFYE
ncbi:MAG: hypothetical protein FWH43_06285 [Endomicrobia bacterium]|nr:hypothetical protein [Endomicrobiia bacterium]